MRLWVWVVAFSAAKLAKVVETLENLEKSLRDEGAIAATEFANTKAGCSMETAARKAEIARMNETLEVLTADAQDAEARMAALEQTVDEKKLELEQVKGLLEDEVAAQDATRKAYEKEKAALEDSKAEMEVAVKENHNIALTATSGLSKLRKLSSALIAAAANAPPSFIQVAERKGDVEEALDAVREDLEELRRGFEAKLAEHQDRVKELEATELPIDRETRKLVPARASAETEKSSTEARLTDLERSRDRAQTALHAHADFCAASLESLGQETELRAEVENSLATAAETLQSNVFTSLVEKSAAALDIPTSPTSPSFLQMAQVRTPGQLRIAPDVDTPPTFIQLADGGDPFADVKGRIRALIDQLRGQRNKDVDLVTWCAEEEKKFETDKVHTKDEVDVLEAEIQMHKTMAADLESAMSVTQEDLAAATARTSVREVNASHAVTASVARSKDHGLAREVVGQAAALIRELFGVAEESGAFLQSTPSESGQSAAADSALHDLEVAERGLASMVSQHDTSSATLETKLSTLKTADAELQKAKKKEASGVDVLLSGHKDMEFEAKDAQKTSQKEVAALESSGEDRRATCMAAGDEKENEMRKQDELASLQDALKVLDGESVPVAGGFLTQRTVQGKVSPLDAAAMAMGIAVRPA